MHLPIHSCAKCAFISVDCLLRLATLVTMPTVKVVKKLKKNKSEARVRYETQEWRRVQHRVVVDIPQNEIDAIEFNLLATPFDSIKAPVTYQHGLEGMAVHSVNGKAVDTCEDAANAANASTNGCRLVLGGFPSWIFRLTSEQNPPVNEDGDLLPPIAAGASFYQNPVKDTTTINRERRARQRQRKKREREEAEAMAEEQW